MHCVNDMDNKCKDTLVYLIVIFRYDTISSSDDSHSEKKILMRDSHSEKNLKKKVEF